ncbi:Uncharacterised protein [Mycobacteroides abscessus subsp. abscessus]|nr:Uncharacterised protein [Mycobacteroides abscessus subsp. abscessus]
MLTELRDRALGGRPRGRTVDTVLGGDQQDVVGRTSSEVTKPPDFMCEDALAPNAPQTSMSSSAAAITTRGRVVANRARVVNIDANSPSEGMILER